MINSSLRSLIMPYGLIMRFALIGSLRSLIMLGYRLANYALMETISDRREHN